MTQKTTDTPTLREALEETVERWGWKPDTDWDGLDLPADEIAYRKRVSAALANHDPVARKLDQHKRLAEALKEAGKRCPDCKRWHLRTCPHLWPMAEDQREDIPCDTQCDDARALLDEVQE